MDDVEIVPYDARWPTSFITEAERLRSVLDPALIAGIEHFGSTAVPGLAAKPIIDILIAVRSLTVARATTIGPITRLGYLSWAENPRQDRMFFVKGMPPHGERRTHHVHITEPDGEMWCRRLAFRDHLRANPNEARRYEGVKRDLAVRYRNDRDGYSQAKTDYCEAIYRAIGIA